MKNLYGPPESKDDCLKECKSDGNTEAFKAPYKNGMRLFEAVSEVKEKARRLGIHRRQAFLVLKGLIVGLHYVFFA